MVFRFYYQPIFFKMAVNSVFVTCKQVYIFLWCAAKQQQDGKPCRNNNMSCFSNHLYIAVGNCYAKI